MKWKSLVGRGWWCGLLVLLVGVEPAAAQEVRSITLREAVQIALDRNTVLQRARAEVEVWDARTRRERTDYLPELTLFTDGSRSFGRSFSQDEGQILSETNDAFGAELSLSMEVFNGFERVASLRRAGLEEEASQWRLARAREDVVFEVTDGFIVLLLSRQLAEVRAEELQTQRELLQQVERLVEVGRRPISDLYQQEAVVAEAEALLVEAERQVTLADIQLIQVLQLDPLGDYSFTAPDLVDTALSAAPEAALDAAAEAVPEYQLEPLLEAALARRSDLRALSAVIAAQHQGVREAESGYWPSLSLGFGYGSGWSSSALQPVPGTGEEPRVVRVMPLEGGAPVPLQVPGTGSDPMYRRPSLWDQLDGRRGGSLSLTVSLPLFDRLQTRTLVEEAEAQLLMARYDLQDQRQTVALQVRQALLDHRSARSQLTAAEARFEAATRAREAARRRYELGAATFVELAQVNAQFAAAAGARVQARYRLVLARQLIEYYTGGMAGEAPPVR